MQLPPDFSGKNENELEREEKERENKWVWRERECSRCASGRLERERIGFEMFEKVVEIDFDGACWLFGLLIGWLRDNSV